MLAAAAVATASLVVPSAWLAQVLGVAAPLVPLWLAWLGLSSLPTTGLFRPRPTRVLGAALLSAAAPPILAVGKAGGLVGTALFATLDNLLGGGGALFTLVSATVCGTLLVLGDHRTRLYRWARATLSAHISPGRRTARARAARSGYHAPGPTASSQQPAPPNTSLETRNQKPERHLIILGPTGELLSERPRPTKRPTAIPASTATLLPAAPPSAATLPLAAQQSTPLRTVGSPSPAPLTSLSPAVRPLSPSPRPPVPAPPDATTPPSPSLRPRNAPLATRHSPLATRHWDLPSLDLLTSAKQATVSATDLKAQARVIEETLESFRLPVRVTEVRQGPTISQFGVEPAPGVAVDRVAARAHDLALRLGARSIRIQAPIPGRTLIGIEVPHGETAVVTLRETLQHASTKDAPALPIALGKDVAGHSVVVDLARLPHLLIAGATGSGKSVGLNALLMSLLMTRTPDDVQFLLIDPKRVELTTYTGVPHLRMPVLTDMDRVIGSLRWALDELESRFSRFAAATCRNLDAYNQRQGSSERLARLMIVIDELADLMMTVPDEVERCLCRLAQLGRAAGIHLVVATQRPSVDVLTGLIKANFPSRLAFAVSSLVDSRVVLDTAGAEQLLGRGDMLFQAPDAARPRRIQGAYVDERELRQVVNFWRRQGRPRFSDQEVVALAELGRQTQADPQDELLARARELAEEHDHLTASFLQRRLNVGYPKAARLLKRLQEEQPPQSTATP